MMADVNAIDGFSPATRAWFDGAFVAPTAAQEGAWAAAQAGRHALVVAHTGSGKTLAAFLWALDRLGTEPAPDQPQHRCRVLYVSPLKALAVDVQRNLRSPLAGIRQRCRGWSGAGSVPSRSSAQRNAASVFPDPVGATTRACRPACAASQAPSWAAVGATKAPPNQARVAGEKPSIALTSAIMRRGYDSFRVEVRGGRCRAQAARPWTECSEHGSRSLPGARLR